MSAWLRALPGARSGVTRTLSSAIPGAPSLPACDIEPQPYQAGEYKEHLSARRRHLPPRALTYYRQPLLLHQGHMQWVWDHQHRRYLDFYGGIVTVSVGHCHPRVTEAAREQLGRLCHTTNIYLHPGIGEYTQRLCATLPSPLEVVFLVNSGSEANDLAMLLARVHTQSNSFITLRGGYHGCSQASMALTSISSWKFNVAPAATVHPTMCPDVYRGLWGGRHCRDSPVQTTRSCDCHSGECRASEGYLGELQDLLRCGVPCRLAAFIAEPIQGVGGVVQYPRGYLRAAAAALIRERGGLFISDEVERGFGRLGSHFWGFETHGVTPDIVTMAKGMGNGFPMGAVVTTPEREGGEIAASLRDGITFNTFGGSPLACAVGNSVLQVMEEEGLQARAETVGTELLHQLADLRNDFQAVGDVRGKGLMVGVDMVASKESREPLPEAQMNQIWEDCREMGLLLGKGGLYGQTFRLKPPLCITREDVDFAVSVMRLALHRHAASGPGPK
ncbi:alanine--glyoxylate aminotransferase 2, mitochondrial [Leucoraja erinacea]|uniref:alanine--glyoxylate aminotransferase 2, mitochondrial n=1 Tax=Leucoraja erinaceus TaxID=7782 RepID=UPI0024567F72|nr:alanine--glyoxylate aminotransferase 2, mitochondrial [Leucoraja erinacea]